MKTKKINATLEAYGFHGNDVRVLELNNGRGLGRVVMVYNKASETDPLLVSLGISANGNYATGLRIVPITLDVRDQLERAVIEHGARRERLREIPVVGRFLSNRVRNLPIEFTVGVKEWKN